MCVCVCVFVCFIEICVCVHARYVRMNERWIYVTWLLGRHIYNQGKYIDVTQSCIRQNIINKPSESRHPCIMNSVQ